ncbi:tail fiber protein [Photorhabdus africana]|uniref:tail fiber protein n=1 Tax=Photorhabdus africana TaxID=3097554 RepID=UPI002B4129E1|nr:tail fiber protein [Photorhabdus sp. CRI-LC]
MEKKNNLSNSEINPENTNNKTEAPSADDLKKRFKAGSIPLQTDYEHLIDMADIGRKATGQAPQQNGPGAGLKLDVNGTLNLKMGTISDLADKGFSPLMLKNDILSVDLGSGLINKDNGISVGQGNGIVVNTDNIAVKAANGITVDGSGVSVKAGNGISVSGNGVEVKAKNNGSISVEPDGIAVKCWDGGGIVVTDNTGLYLKLEGGNTNNAWSGVSGLSLSKNGVKVKAGNGIKVDDKGVSIDPNKVLPRGMIVMFSGDSAPPGWAFCDGGTYDGVKVPDLRNRFIACGNTMSETKGKSLNTLSGEINNKIYSIMTKTAKTNLNVTVNETKLTEEQLPSHFHYNGMRYDSHKGNLYAWRKLEEMTADKLQNGSESVVKSKGERPYEFKTSTVGSGQGHKHTASVSDSGHSHSVDITTPYYLLAFIMKL